MKRLIALLLVCLGTPAFAQGQVTILRGSSAPPEPTPSPPPAPVVVERQTVIQLPAYSTTYWPLVVVNPGPLPHGRAHTAAPAVPNGWPLLGRNR
jgi:hypothetical protein